MKKADKKRGGASVYILAVYVLVLLGVVWLYGSHLRTLQHIRNEFDTGLLAALLGTLTINTEEFGLSGNQVIHDTFSGEEIWGAEENAAVLDGHLTGAVERFWHLLRINLGLTEEGNSQKTAVNGAVMVEEFKVFNLYKNTAGDRQIYEFTWENGSWSVLVHPVNEKVYVAGNGDRGTKRQEVTDTTIYAKIGFEVDKVRVCMQRSVSVAGNGK